MCVPEPLRTQCSKSSLDFVLSSVISPTQMGPEITKSPLYCGFAAAVSEGALSPLFIRKTTFHSPGPDNSVPSTVFLAQSWMEFM